VSVILPKSQVNWKTWYDADDPVLSLQFIGSDKFEPTRTLYHNIIKKHGDGPVSWWDDQPEFDATQELDENKDYSGWELEQLASQMLRDDSKREMCRQCGKYGEETGNIESMPQYDKDTGEPILDDEGNLLYMDFPEVTCEDGHRWYLGEGKARGIQGQDPILFENHLQDRRRREIYTTIGTPDPSIQQGMYNRTHPQGRKVNSKEQRRRNGASFFR
jgi:hypothetical protein